MLVGTGIVVLIIWLLIIAAEIEQIKQNTNKIMATQADLDAAIAALPAAIEAAVEAALAPVIAAIEAKAGTTDFSSEITSLNAIGATVGAKVAADLTPPSPVQPPVPGA